MAVFTALITASACAHRVNKAPTDTPSASSTSTTESVTSPSSSQSVQSTALHLNEVQLTETAGQRSLLFRFSRPPEGVDYFPLRNPSRLVVDVKGPIDSPTKVQTYKAADAQVTSVRVGSYQGRLRLVIDLKGTAVPQFSVDNYETLVSAFIGEKDLNKSAASSHSQVLVASADDGRGTQNLATASQPEKKTLTTASSSGSESRSVKPSTPSTESAKTKSVVSAEALPEEKLSSTAITTKAPVTKHTPTAPTASPEIPTSPTSNRPIDIAQAEQDAPEKSAPSPKRPRSRHPRIGEEPLLPPVSTEPSSLLSPSGEFRPISTTEYSGRKISLDFKNADIHDVFRILADVSGLNIVATDDVKARVTLRLVEIPWDQALDVVLQANGLEKTRVGNVITISTTKRLETERNARLLALNAQRKIAPLETAYVKINYVKATDIVALLTREIEQMATTSGGIGGGGVGSVGSSAGAGGKNQQVAVMSPRGTVAADATTNIVIIRDVADRLTAVKELVSKIDVQTPQVVIESYIITTSENLNRDLGIDWGYQYNASTQTGNATGLNFPGSIGLGGDTTRDSTGKITGTLPIVSFPATTAGNALNLNLGSLTGSQALSLRLSALENQGKTRVIARPRVVTLNNKAAEIKSLRTIRVPITSGSLNVGGAGSTQGGGSAFQEFSVGIILKITPQISSDGFVLLDIAAESSEPVPSTVGAVGNGSAFPAIPDSLSRTTSSSVLIRANDTFVLGGIFQDNMQQTERGIPYLRDAPGLGWLFRGDSRAKSKTELMIFITPKLVAGSGTAGLPTAQQLWENRPREVAPTASTSATTLGR